MFLAMGIAGLLPALKSITEKVHVSKYAGKRVAVDMYVWLHSSALQCSKKICEGKPPRRFARDCMERVKMLKRHGVVPIIVFDGGLLPAKAEEELKRARKREETLARAVGAEEAGDMAAAKRFYRQAVDITPALANELVQELKASGVEYVVAPYEADAQMAYLALSGRVHAVISDDSDLIAYGCPRVRSRSTTSSFSSASLSPPRPACRFPSPPSPPPPSACPVL
eukprot:jgi/Mesen1/3091/ME000184S02153